MMTYKEAIDYLAFTSKRGSCLGLSRVTQLLERLENPHKNVKFIHVTGTNGKGSVTKMLSCILNAQGYKTGLFSSPFVTKVNESIQLDGNEISDSEFAELIGDIMPVAEAMDEPPTEFEITTAVKNRKQILIVFNSVYRQEQWIPSWYKSLRQYNQVNELARIPFWRDASHIQDSYQDIRRYLI